MSLITTFVPKICLIKLSLTVYWDFNHCFILISGITGWIILRVTPSNCVSVFTQPQNAHLPQWNMTSRHFSVFFLFSSCKQSRRTKVCILKVCFSSAVPSAYGGWWFSQSLDAETKRHPSEDVCLLSGLTWKENMQSVKTSLASIHPIILKPPAVVCAQTTFYQTQLWRENTSLPNEEKMFPLFYLFCFFWVVAGREVEFSKSSGSVSNIQALVRGLWSWSFARFSQLTFTFSRHFYPKWRKKWGTNIMETSRGLVSGTRSLLTPHEAVEFGFWEANSGR